MGKTHRFKEKPRRPRESEPYHWLGLGESGQESLLLDLTPPLYASDQAIYSAIASTAFNYRGQEERPFALFVPPLGAITWHISYLSKHFNTYVWASAEEDFYEEVQVRFGSEAISGTLPEALPRAVDLCLCLDSAFASLHELKVRVREYTAGLSVRGRLVLLLESEQLSSSAPFNLRFQDDSKLPVEALQELDGMLLGLELINIESIAYRELSSEFKSSFLKRNQGFFGRGMRDSLDQRIREPDFMSLSSGEGSRQAIVVELLFS